MGKIIVKVKLTNRVAYLVSPYDYDKLIPYWSHSVSSYVYMSKPWYRKCKVCRLPKQAEHIDHDYIPVWDGRIKLLKRDCLPAGLFLATYREIEKKEHIKFKVSRHVQVPKLSHPKHWIRSVDKYSFQNDCTTEIIDSIVQGKGGLVLSATGSGKTRIAAMVASRLNCELLFIVDQLDLLEQARRDIKLHLSEKIGKVGESKFKLKRVTVATIQTLHLHRNDNKFRKWFSRVEVIIIDEIHTMLNKSNFDVIRLAKPLSTIGLTATLGISQKPVRLKAYSLTGDIIYEYQIVRGVEDNVLAKGIGISLEYENKIQDIDGYTANEAYEEKIVENTERNWIITQIIKRAVKLGKYIIVLVERIKHLELLSSALDKLKIKHKVVSGTFKGKHIKLSSRLKSKDKFETGSIRVILANKVFKKGIDIKRLDLVINATGRRSKNDAIQIFGRGVRLHKDKKGLIYVDITDIDTNSRNWFHKAGKSRIRALKKIGIKISKLKYVDYVDEDNIKELFTRAERMLDKELKHE